MTEVVSGTQESVHIKTTTTAKGLHQIEVSVIGQTTEKALELWKSANAAIRSELKSNGFKIAGEDSE